VHGLFWNFRGLGKIGRVPSLVNRIRNTRADLVGVIETKKESFSPCYLKSITGNIPFDWFSLPAKGSAGGIYLVGRNRDKFVVTICVRMDFSISVMRLDKKTGFSWKLASGGFSGSPYEEGTDDFIKELHLVMQAW
jgi:hypothetical protein